MSATTQQGTEVIQTTEVEEVQKMAAEPSRLEKMIQATSEMKVKVDALLKDVAEGKINQAELNSRLTVIMDELEQAEPTAFQIVVRRFFPNKTKPYVWHSNLLGQSNGPRRSARLSKNPKVNYVY